MSDEELIKESFPIENITEDEGIKKQILSLGTGDATPQKGAVCSMLYTGKLLDGKVFDSTSTRGNKPFEFTIGEG